MGKSREAWPGMGAAPWEPAHGPGRAGSRAGRRITGWGHRGASTPLCVGTENTEVLLQLQGLGSPGQTGSTPGQAKL